MAIHGVTRIAVRFLVLVAFVTKAEVQHIELQGAHPKIPNVHIPHTEDIPTSSIILETTSSKKTDLNFIHLVNSPKVHTPGNNVVQVEYSCQIGDVIGLDIVASSELQSGVTIFHRHWDCLTSMGNIQLMLVKLKLPDSISYRPDFLMPHSIIIHQMNYKVWVIPKSLFALQRKHAYEMSVANAVYSVAVAMPYMRPRKNHEGEVCLRWDTKILMNVREEEVLRCAYEPDVIQLMKYPVALAGRMTGITRELTEFKSRYLQAQKIKHLTDPKFTISTLIYIVDYCKWPLCGIIHRKTHYTNVYTTPLLFLNPKGEVHIQVVLSNGQASSMLSNYPLPKHEWIRLVFTMDGKKWKLHMSHGKGFRKTITAQAAFSEPVQYNDTEGLLYLGGSTNVASFRGYMAETTLWRNKVLETNQVPFPSLHDDMYRVGLEESHSKCRAFTAKMEEVYATYQAQSEWVIAQRSCSNSFTTIIGLNASYFPPHPYCRLWGRRPPRNKHVVWTAVKHLVVEGGEYNKSFDLIGKILYKDATSKLVEGMNIVPQIIPILKQASCYGNNKASYMLSTLYSGGMGITPDKHKGNKYQLIAAQGDYAPASCAMGDKHQVGQEGIPQDLDYAFNYFKNVADKTVKDKETHDEDGIYTEMVRLTDTNALMHQTGEKGDYFLWMKYQAKKGLADAQISLARMLFWGQHGVTRDLPLAIQYFNEYLQNNPADPLANYDMAVILFRSTVARMMFWGQGGVKRNMQAAVHYYANAIKEAPANPIGHYDYGIILLRGQGTAKNFTRAMEHLNKSAELGHPPAYTALGWYALNHEMNVTAAIKYFEKADSMGHRDAAHNLGYLYRSGKYPGHPTDEVMAFRFYYRAASGGHIDSGVIIAEMHNQGNIEMLRNNEHAVSWARYIGEQNTEMGRILRKALDSYLEGSWAESLIYYMMAAEAGLEVAQFNLAFLCEEDHENIAASYVHADCVWKYYNKSSNSNKPPVLAQIKMGDYHWYGYQGEKDTNKAVDYYGKAAVQQDPQAMFNLGYVIEHGIELKPDLLKSLGINQSVVNTTDKRILSMELYRKCRDHANNDAYIPCGMAVLRLQWQDLWINHTLLMKISSAILFGLASSLIIVTCLTHIRGYESSVENV